MKAKARKLRPDPPGGWRWSFTHLCGAHVTVAKAVAPDVPFWCEACARAFSTPCHTHACETCQRERAALPPAQLELW